MSPSTTHHPAPTTRAAHPAAMSTVEIKTRIAAMFDDTTDEPPDRMPLAAPLGGLTGTTSRSDT